MAIKVIAQRRELKIGKNPGVKKFVMRPDLYIPIPGLGTMRFGVRSKAVEKLEDVKTGLITTRRIVFTPNVEVVTDNGKYRGVLISNNASGVEVEISLGISRTFQHSEIRKLNFLQ